MARTKATVVKTEPVKRGTPEDIQDAWRMLAGGAPAAAQALVDIARFGRSEVARVQASQTILDRVNLGARNEVTIRAVPLEYDQGAMPDDGVSPSVLIARRLAQLTAGQQEPTTAEPGFGEQVVEAELVEADPWQEPASAHRPLRFGEIPEPDGQF